MSRLIKQSSMRRRLKHSLILASLVVLLIAGVSSPTKAQISDCNAAMTPHTVAPGSTVDFQLQLTNNDPANEIQWIQILRPSEDFTIVSVTAPTGWSATVESTDAVVSGSTMEPGETDTFTVHTQVANNEAAAANWSVFVSDSPDGSGNTFCNADTSTEITSNQPFQISNISISAITQSSATISWTTNRPADATVNYGLTTSYGGSAQDESGNLSTGHSLNLTDLKSGKLYHFQVSSTTADSQTATSSDNSFSTLTQNNSSVSTPAGPVDKIPPTISLSTNIKNPFHSIPKLSGTATDNVSVVKVEYSVDGGSNWLPADSLSLTNSKKASFNFTPQALSDGNYLLVLRATDSAGNSATTTAGTLIIDLEPPLVGGNLINLGPQILEPDQNGIISTVTDINQTITLSAVGGPTNIMLSAVSEALAKPLTFSLSHSQETDLWKGTLNFHQPGNYTLVANSIDGGGNQTSRIIDRVYVSRPSQLNDAKTHKPVTGKITAYYLQPETNQWIVWDGAPYAQANPASTAANGQFSMFLPAGKYYLRFKAKGFKSSNSNIFKLSRPTPLITTVSLRPGRDWKIGPLSFSWLDLSAQTIKLNPDQSKTTTSDIKKLIGQPLPDLSLLNTDGTTLDNTELLGKPTVLSFISTWHPLASEQLSILAQVAANKNINIRPVALQEGADKANAYNAIGNYNLTWLADPQSTANTAFDINSIPTSLFVDRNGVIKNVIEGVLSKQQVLDNLPL